MFQQSMRNAARLYSSDHKHEGDNATSKAAEKPWVKGPGLKDFMKGATVGSSSAASAPIEKSTFEDHYLLKHEQRLQQAHTTPRKSTFIY